MESESKNTPPDIPRSNVPPRPSSLVTKWQDLINTLAELMNLKAVVITYAEIPELEIIAANDSPDSPFKIGSRHKIGGHYCEDVLQRKIPLLIEDARESERWAQSPEAQAGLIAYMGCPLLWPDNSLFGSLCLFGTRPHQIAPLHQALVKHICELIEGQLAVHFEAWQAQHDAQVMFETIFESSPDAIAILDMQATIEQCNRVFWEMYGSDNREALTGVSAFDLIPAHERPRARQHLAALPIQGTIRNTNYTFMTKRGDAIPVEVSSSITRDNEGKPHNVILIVQDITERKQAESTLAEQEAQLRSLFRAAPIGIGLLHNRVFKHVNDQFCMMTGYQKEELIDQNARLLYPTQQEYERVGRDKYGQIKKQGTGTVETQWRHKNGKILDILLSSTPLNREDWSQGVTFTALDITERKTYQSKLRSLAQQLSIAEERERRRVAVGVHDDIGQKLVLAKLELQSLQQLVEAGTTSDALSRVCDIIDETMQEARTLAFDLSNPVLYEVGFDAAVESWLARQVKEISDLEYHFTTHSGRVKLPEQHQVMLFQIVREILTNVLKHAQAKLVDVVINNRAQELSITIADDGVGFEPQTLNWDTEHSSGLGLFNVRERLEYLSGHLDIESQAGEGTTVTITIPTQIKESNQDFG